MKDNQNTMHKLKKWLFYSLVSLTLVSCKKDMSSPLGENLQPADEYLDAEYADTLQALTLYCYSKQEKPANLSGRPYYQLGSFKDDIFGVSTYNLITQIIPAENVAPMANSTLDSIVFNFNYSYDQSGLSMTYPQVSSSGERLDPFTLNIFELDEYLDPFDSTLYSNRVPKYKSTALLSNKQITPTPFDSVYVGEDTLAPAIRIRMSDDLGRRLLNLPESDYADNNTFINAFKGFYFQVSPEMQTNKGSSVLLAASTSMAQLIIYYKEPGQTTQKQLTFVMKGGTLTYCQNYSQVIHDYTSASNDLKAMLSGDTSVGQQYLYVQGSVGLTTKINFPFIKDLRNKNIIINQAKLIFDVQNAQDKYLAPDYMAIYYSKDSLSTEYMLPDQASSSSTDGIGGILKNGEYAFYITRYIQQMLYHDSPNYELTIAPFSKNYAAEQVRLFGTNKQLSPQRARLELIYTQIPE